MSRSVGSAPAAGRPGWTHLGCGVVHHLLCREVTLVAHQQLVHVLAGIAVDLLQPLFDIVEGLLGHTEDDASALHNISVKLPFESSTDLIRHVVNHYNAVSSSVVTGRDGAEAFLTSRVPLRSRSRPSESTHTHSRVYQHLSVHSVLPTHNLKLYGLSIQLDGPDLEVNTNRANVALCVGVILSETNMHTHTRGSGR